MGMDAELLGFGKFKRDIAEHLDYPENFYKDTPEGCEILTLIFACSTSQSSEALAMALGISPWKFEEHKITITKEILDDLFFFAEDHVMEEDWKDLEALYKAGFTFHYRPNG